MKLKDALLLEKSAHSFYIDRGVSDLLKIISALLVMFAHYCTAKGDLGLPLNLIETVIRSQGGNVGVAVFFFLSGYGLMMSELKSHLSFKQFLKKRFFKIYLPVLLITAIWLPIVYSINPQFSNNLVIIDLMWGFRDPVLWFIKSLIILYTVFFIFTWFLSRNEYIWAIVILWLSTIIACILSYHINDSFSVGATQSLPLFSVGVMSVLLSNKKSRFIHPTFLFLIFSFFGISVLLAFLPNKFLQSLVHVMCDYSAVCFILIVCTHYRLKIKIPSFLALLSFDIYLVHFKVLTVIKRELTTPSIFIFILGTFVLSIIFFYLRKFIFSFLEKIFKPHNLNNGQIDKAV